MSNERIDLDQLEEEIANLQDMHFDTRLDERVANANMFNRMLNELARCYGKIDWLQQVADLAADNVGRKNWDGFEEAMYEAGLWERPSE